MATFTKYQTGVAALLEAINAGTDAFKVCLTNNAPVVATDTTVTAGTTDLATGNGYTAGGNAATIASHTQTAGVYKLVLNSPATWTASVGNIGPFRYALLYDSTTNNLIGYWDYGSALTLLGANGDTFTVTLDATNGTFQVS